MATPMRPVMEIDVVFESFICTVCTTISAVAGDSDLVRVNRFKLYLLTAVVPVTTISTSLGLEHDQHVDTTCTRSVVCQRILADIIEKVKFLQHLPKSHRVFELLNRFINEKLDKIQSKLDAYLNMTDFYTAVCQDEC